MAGFGLEIQVRYTLVGAEKAVNWVETKRILNVTESKTINIQIFEQDKYSTFRI